MLFYQSSTIKYFGLVIPLIFISFFFFKTSRNYMSNIIIIVSNITNISVPQCYFILKFYILWLWPMVSITRALQVPPPLISLPLPHFHQGCMLFYKPSFSSFVIYMCFIRRFFTVLPWWNYESIISRFHCFLLGLSSNHVT